MSTDPFSDVLQLTEARSVISGRFAAGGTWALRFPPLREIKFFVVTKGSCWVRVDGWKRAVRWEEGDVGLSAGRKGFLVGSSLTARPLEALRVFGDGGGLTTIGDGSELLALAGGVWLDPTSAMVLTDVLPDLVHVRAASPSAAGLRWIVEQIAEEQASTLAGSRAASAQLAQLLFIQILRAHLHGKGALPSGWLHAMRDERIAPALRLMHGDPRRAWRLPELAKAAGMSRTSFAVHFKSVVGLAPLGYLTTWRMRLAQRALRDEDAPVSEVAASLGYGSESAFSQAFKRVTGERPRDWRKAARGLGSAGEPG